MGARPGYIAAFSFGQRIGGAFHSGAHANDRSAATRSSGLMHSGSASSKSAKYIALARRSPADKTFASATAVKAICSSFERRSKRVTEKLSVLRFLSQSRVKLTRSHILRRCVDMVARTPPSTSSAELLQKGSNCMNGAFRSLLLMPQTPCLFLLFVHAEHSATATRRKFVSCTQVCLCKFWPRCGRSLSTVWMNSPTGRDLRHTPTQ